MGKRQTDSMNASKRQRNRRCQPARKTGRKTYIETGVRGGEGEQGAGGRDGEREREREREREKEGGGRKKDGYRV